VNAIIEYYKQIRTRERQLLATKTTIFAYNPFDLLQNLFYLEEMLEKSEFLDMYTYP
jgi:hypothetical protein